MARVRKNLRGRRGVSMVEAALVLTLLMVLTFAAFEYGWLFLKAQQVANAARHGARTAAVANGTWADADTAARSLIASAGMADPEVVITPADIEDMEPGTALTVKVSVLTEPLSLTGFPLPMPERISSSVTMAKEGQ